MGTRTLTLELPEEIVALLGAPETAAARARAMVVLELLREARISQGKAAELLGLTRADILDLMLEHEIPSALRTAEDVQEAFDNVRRYLQQQSEHGGDQR